ncbi:MAG: pyridoxal phosphate-dependent aminotransferase [Actinomycetota bacterium]|nr:pyridoxal phosphate-dependent aminotransferase [Actinomycetota bacterium]
MSLAARITGLAPSATMAVDAKAKALRAAGEPVIGFAAGEPDFPTPGHIVEAAQRAAADPAMHRYTPAAGLAPLREAIAERARRDGLDVTAEMVVVTNGGKHALYNVFMALIGPGDEVLMPAPYWVSYPEQIGLAGGTCVPILADAAASFRVSVDQLEAARTPRTKALVFVSPSNPTGAVYPPEDVAAIGRWAAEHGIWVVTDEIYRELVYGQARFSSLPAVAPEAAPRTIIIDGLAKTYAMTGWRVGWSIAPLDISAGITKLQTQLCSNVNNVAQAAAIAALTGPQDAVEKMRLAFDRRRHTSVTMLRAIDGFDVVEPEGAFYVYPSVRDLIGVIVAGHSIGSSLQLADVLLDTAKVAVVPGEGFGSEASFRLSYALSDADLEEGISRIAKVIAG